MSARAPAASIAAGLVNGVSPHRMVRMFVEDDDAETAFDPALMLRPAYREWRRALRAAPSGVSASVGAGLNEALLGPQAAFWRAVERGLRMLPNGLVDGSPAERKLAHLLTQPGRTNDFRRTRAPLRIVATDIDSGDPVEFGAPGHDHIPISRAAIASRRGPRPVRAGANRHPPLSRRRAQQDGACVGAPGIRRRPGAVCQSAGALPRRASGGASRRARASAR